MQPSVAPACGALVNHFPNKPLFLRVCNTSLLKTLWEKEKSLVTILDNFSAFSSNLELSSVKTLSLERFKISLLGKGC